MRKQVVRLSWLVLVVLSASLVAVGQDVSSTGKLAFGFGGSMGMALFPDLEGINAFLSENALDPLGGVLFGSGGSGRGGTVGGWSFGGMGWGAVSSSSSEDRHADLVIGGGGFDLGLAIGGDENSVLTLGTVLGGGATVLVLTSEGQMDADAAPQGVVVEPVERVLGRGFGLVLPYVSLEAQIASWVGLEVRIGYLVPVGGVDFGDLVGVPAPSLDISGPFVGISLVFGGIGRVDADAKISSGSRGATQTSSGSFDLGDTPGLSIENRAGEIVVMSYALDAAQTGSGRVVEWEAVRRARGPRELAALLVEVGGTPDEATFRTVGRGTVDYLVRVPAGTDLKIVQGAGRVEIGPHAATVVAVTLGAGDVVLSGVSAPETSVSVGAGTVTLSGVEAVLLTAHVGAGEIRLDVRRDVSATVSASVGLGDAEISGFPGMAAVEQGFLGRTVNALLGNGASRFSLSAGIGTIEVRPLLP